MNKQLEAEYLSYLQEHLEITPYHAVQGNYYEYEMGDIYYFNQVLGISTTAMS